MSDPHGGGGGGISGGAKSAIVYGIALLVIVAGIQGLANITKGQPITSNIIGSSGPPSPVFNGLTNRSRSGYVPGAPKTPKECFDRGGELAKGGRGCSGYR